MSPAITPERITAPQAQAILPQLVALLQDGVQHGASIGFLRPLAADSAEQFWQEVIRDVAAGARILLVLRDGDRIAGSVQLGLCLKPNGRHRAEVQKLMVRHARRGRGLGQALMQRAEAEARAHGRRLLFLDTSVGEGGAVRFYERLGYTLAGSIPDYAADPDGQLRPNAIFYKQLT